MGGPKETDPLYIVASQLNTFTALGKAIIIVDTIKVIPRMGFMPDTNMWWPQTKKPRMAMARPKSVVANSEASNASPSQSVGTGMRRARLERKNGFPMLVTPSTPASPSTNCPATPTHWKSVSSLGPEIRPTAEPSATQRRNNELVSNRAGGTTETV